MTKDEEGVVLETTFTIDQLAAADKDTLQELMTDINFTGKKKLLLQSALKKYERSHAMGMFLQLP